MSERDRSSQRVSKGKADELVFMALGGLGEIGMNTYLYGFGPPGYCCCSMRNRSTGSLRYASTNSAATIAA